MGIESKSRACSTCWYACSDACSRRVIARSAPAASLRCWISSAAARMNSAGNKAWAAAPPAPPTSSSNCASSCSYSRLRVNGAHISASTVSCTNARAASRSSSTIEWARVTRRSWSEGWSEAMDASTAVSAAFTVPASSSTSSTALSRSGASAVCLITRRKTEPCSKLGRYTPLVSITCAARPCSSASARKLGSRCSTRPTKARHRSCERAARWSPRSALVSVAEMSSPSCSEHACTISSNLHRRCSAVSSAAGSASTSRSVSASCERRAAHSGGIASSSCRACSACSLATSVSIPHISSGSWHSCGWLVKSARSAARSSSSDAPPSDSSCVRFLTATKPCVCSLTSAARSILTLARKSPRGGSVSHLVTTPIVRSPRGSWSSASLSAFELWKSSHAATQQRRIMRLFAAHCAVSAVVASSTSGCVALIAVIPGRSHIVIVTPDGRSTRT
mmetsp:Transcript_12862/g.29055  ORF Transcript_12862/g.29055 Transcript_12862/m.29055 type:complete len:450 (-) Transcript_12862:457-1806(-)